jgi:hypothetical protein
MSGRLRYKLVQKYQLRDPLQGSAVTNVNTYAPQLFTVECLLTVEPERNTLSSLCYLNEICNLLISNKIKIVQKISKLIAVG